MTETEALEIHLQNIDYKATEIITCLRKAKFDVDLHKLNHIPRTEDSVGPMEIESYSVETINFWSRESILKEVHRSLKRSFRNESQFGSDRLVGTIKIDTDTDTELALSNLICELNTEKENVGKWLSSHYPDMNKRMEFIRRPSSPLYNTIMPTIHRKILAPNLNKNRFFKSVSFSWVEKGVKSYKLRSREQLEKHLKHYSATVDLDMLLMDFPLNESQPWTVALPQRVHPIVNVTIVNEHGELIQRLPFKAHTPIFLFSSLQTRIKPFVEYEKRTGLKQFGPNYLPIRSDLSLYRYVG